MEPILSDDRDRRTWAWICAQVGEDRARLTCSQLAGQRRPYVSNVVKELGLKVPGDVIDPPTASEVARENIAAMKALLKRRPA